MVNRVEPILDALALSFTRVECRKWSSPLFARRIAKGVHFVLDLMFEEFDDVVVFPDVGVRVDRVERRFYKLVGDHRALSFGCALAQFGWVDAVRVNHVNSLTAAAQVLQTAERAWSEISKATKDICDIPAFRHFQRGNAISRALMEFEYSGKACELTRSRLSIDNPYELAVLRFLESTGSA